MANPQASERPRIVYLYLATVVLTWAGNWPLMKLAIAEAPPLSFVLYRMLGAMAIMVPMMAVLRTPMLPARGERGGMFLVGLFQVAGFLICSIIGLSIVPAGRAIVLGYTMPLWAIPIELWLEPNRLGRMQLLGGAIGFAGLLLFMNPGLVDWGDIRVLGGNAMLVMAAICWALGSVLYRRRTWRSPFWTQTFWQLAISTVIIVLVATPGAMARPVHWSPLLVAVLAYNWLVTTALGYFLWNKVLSVMPAGVAGQVMALTPIGGFMLSVAIFGGDITVDVIASIVLIVAGIVVTLRG